jgi:hypothetical protein
MRRRDRGLAWADGTIERLERRRRVLLRLLAGLIVLQVVALLWAVATGVDLPWWVWWVVLND